MKIKMKHFVVIFAMFLLCILGRYLCLKFLSTDERERRGATTKVDGLNLSLCQKTMLLLQLFMHHLDNLRDVLNLHTTQKVAITAQPFAEGDVKIYSSHLIHFSTKVTIFDISAKVANSFCCE